MHLYLKCQQNFEQLLVHTIWKSSGLAVKQLWDSFLGLVLIQLVSSNKQNKYSQTLNYWGWDTAGTLPRGHVSVFALLLWQQHYHNHCLKSYYLTCLAFHFILFLIFLCFLHYPSNRYNCLVHSQSIYCTWLFIAQVCALCSDSLLSASDWWEKKSFHKE